METPVFVSEDVVWQSNKDALRLFFGRQQVSGGGQPFSLLKNSPPPYHLFQDTFVSVYSVAEVYGYVPAIAAPGALSQPYVMFRQPSYRPPEIEFDIQRFNHQSYFQVKTGFGPQMVGYVADQPDFCDHPWLEWVHPPASPESAIYPFRQVPRSIRGQQYNFLFYKAPNWKLEAEPDHLRKTDHGLFELMWDRPALYVPLEPGRSKRLVYSTTATSPRALTSARMAATARSTDSS